jgi:hypothetical protein
MLCRRAIASTLKSKTGPSSYSIDSMVVRSFLTRNHLTECQRVLKRLTLVGQAKTNLLGEAFDIFAGDSESMQVPSF